MIISKRHILALLVLGICTVGLVRGAPAREPEYKDDKGPGGYTAKEKQEYLQYGYNLLEPAAGRPAGCFVRSSLIVEHNPAYGTQKDACIDDHVKPNMDWYKQKANDKKYVLKK
jgi:hypothetical protein